MKKLLLIAVAVFQLTLTKAQPPQSWTSADMYLALRKLNVLGSVLYIAAHPDDENTRLIAYLSKDRMFRTGYLSLTRGDGGQNLIGDEQGIELGLIRTQELLAARRMDGGEQFFSRAFDFGFSKNPEETFTKWDKEKILSDVVWVIRKFQPDVIITRFPTTGEGGHGHHTASAILANEAYAAAADPTRFPEQLKYVSVWQTKRVLWNTFNFGGTNTTRDDQYKIDVGGYNPLLGKSYGEIAAESRSQHKSQGFGVPASRGESLEYFKATKGDQPVNDLMDGTDLTWKRVSGGEAISKLIDSLSKNFDLLHPENSVEGLVKLYKAMNALPDNYWKTQKLKEVNQLIAQCSGLFLEASTTEQFAVQTDSVRINFLFNNRLGTNAELQRVTVDNFDSAFAKPLEKNRNLGFTKTIFVSTEKPITQPYWLANKMAEGYFNVTDQEKIGQPDIDPSYLATIKVKIFGETFNFVRPVKYKFTDPVKGELYWPLVVVPPVTISPSQNVKIIVNDQNNAEGLLTVKGLKKGFSGSLVASAENGQQAVPGFTFGPAQVAVAAKNQVIEAGYSAKKDKTLDNVLFSVQDANGSRFSKDKHEIKYDHIPAVNYFHDAVVKLRYVDVKTYNKKIGYIVGAGDKVPEALEQMGYEVTLLTDKELSRNHLDQYDCIITGVRTYNTNEWMNKHYDKLMKYVNDGGNLIVQYNTSNQIGPVRAKIGPFDFNITRNRVTDENAAVTILKPEHPVFNFPNKITQDDFKGWIQERSIYHADTSSKYERLVSMNDPGEKADDGALIVTKYGKGWFTYTGLVFFRELPAGVPGAYRLFANLIALNKKKGF